MNNRTKLPGRLARVGLVMLAFVVTSCGDDNPSNPPTTGSIQVSASTTGAELDADGYTVTVDGGAGQALAINGSTTFANQTPGAREVELSGVAANCTVAGDNPRDVSVTAGSTATTTFTVTCSATAGEIEVTAVSTGEDIDADGYTVSVDGGAAQAIAVDGTLTVSGLDAGDHTVELGDVAANCTVGGDNPRTVAVTAGATAATQFDVACTALPGGVNVVNVTTGGNPDDAYTVSVDGGAPQALAANDSVAVAGLSAGDHTVELGDVAANCTVADDNPRTVTVTSDSEVRTQFDVTCVSAGGLDLTTSSWGLGLDANGYNVVVDAGAPQAIGVNETVSLNLTVGDHSVEVTDIAANCTLQGGTNPRTVTVVDGAVTATQFDVFCWQTLLGNVVFETDRDGDHEIYVRIPGGAVTNMTNNSALDANPSVSSDGNAVVFNSDRSGSGIWRMDSSGFTNLTTSGTEFDPSYTGLAGSRQIAFVSRSGGDDRILTMNNTGAARTTVAATAGFDNNQPAFSPDGNWILFTSNRDGDEEIYVVNVNTLTQTRLTNNAGVDGKPAWWFDGSRILWVSNRTGDYEVWAADFDSVTPAISNLENLTNDNTQDDLMPAMRPDGASIMAVNGTSGSRNIYTMDPDGTNQQPLFTTGSDDLNPAWSPWP